MPKEKLDTLFAAMWPQLEAKVAEAMQHPDAAVDAGPQRGVEDMVAEVVEKVRRIERATRPKPQVIDSRSLQQVRGLPASDR
jgi:hypothetical protein